MRLIALVVAAVLASAPAHAAWNEYVYADLEVAKDFPAPPTMQKITYKGPLAKEAAATVLSVVQSGITYKMTVVDFTKRAAEGANLLGEAANAAIQGEGTKVLLDDFPLYDKGANSVYGTMMTIDKANGEHSKEAFFFNKGRLYMIQAVVPPGSANRNSADIARFMPSVRFYLAGYGFDLATGHDFPIGDDKPEDRDTRVIPGYKPTPGFVPPVDQPLLKKNP